MKSYYIEYFTKDNVKEKKYIEAKNVKELEEYCKKNQYIIHKYKAVNPIIKFFNLIFLKKKNIKKYLNDKDAYKIINSLYIISYAEIPSNRRLEYMIKSVNSKKLKPLITIFNSEITDGTEISKALEKMGMPDYIVYSVKVGSETGEMKKIYEKILEVLKNKLETKKKMKKLLRNPLIYFVLLFGMFHFFMFFYYPRIKDVLKYIDKSKFPYITEVFLNWSNYATSSFWHGFIFVLISLSIFISSLYIGGKIVKNIIKYIPGLKNIFLLEDYIIFFSLLNIAITSKMSSFNAIELAAESLNNYNLKKALLNAVEEIKDGEYFSKIAEKNKIFNNDFEIEAAIINFEETQDTKHFNILVEMKKEKLDTLIDSMSSFIQPILILIVLIFIVLFQYAANAPLWNFSQQ